ncbi:MAG: hypothetical protein IT208_18235 [Chthonomonadales bacterium]|nr:hypothetical protein [Chthonomonadales bacterium]
MRRNPGRTLPVAFVIVVAVALVASIVSIVDSIDLTVLTMYGYQRHFAVVTPRNALTVSPDIDLAVRSLPGVGRIFTARPAFTVVKTVFGKMPYVVFGLPPAGRAEVFRRCRLSMVSGRMPAEGKAEVALSEEIARNRRLQLGSVVLSPESEDSYATVPMRLCGTFRGPVWLALTSESFIADNFAVAPRGLVVTAAAPGGQRALDSALTRSVDRARARVWTYDRLVRDTHDALSSLYLIMAIVVGIVVFAIAFLTGLLANIYFTQRLPEFATLAAIGYQRAGLLARALGEIALLCSAGWLFGALLTAGVLSTLRETVMVPRGLLLDPFDMGAYRYTLPLPLAIASFAIVAMARRLRALDPVSIIERRQ